jgi:PAS domain S-box-containing protein
MENKVNEFINSADQSLICLPYLRWDISGNILEVSPSLYQKCGFSSKFSFMEEFKTISDFLYYPSLEVINSTLVENNNKLYRYPILLKTSFDSQFINVLVDLDVSEGNDYAASIGIDSNDFRSSTFEYAPIGIFVSTIEEGRFLIVNKKLVEIYGYDSCEEMLLVSDIASEIYFNRDDRERLLKRLNEIEPGQKVEDFQFVAKRKDGTLIVISKDVVPVFHENTNTIIYMFGYVKSISESIEDIDSPLPNFKCAVTGEIIHVNNATAELLGYSQEHLRGMNIKELYFDPDERAFWLDLLREKGSLSSSPRILRKKNGEKLRIFTDVSILKSRIGNTIYEVCIKGWVSFRFNPEGSMTWIEKLNSLIVSDEYALSPEIQGLSINAAYNVSKELDITYLSDKEILKVVENIRNLCSTFEPFDPSNLEEGICTIREMIELDIWHSLNFFSFRDEMLRNACNISQVSSFLDISEVSVVENWEKKNLLAIDKDGELLFPIWQFDRREDNGIVQNLSDILNSLEVPDIAKLSWLMNPSKVFEGIKPCEILKHGSPEDKQRVINEAHGVGGC